MQFEIRKKENHTLIKVLAEKLNANNSAELKSQLVVVNGQGEKNIILDLSSCQYCDSSGLRAVLVANRLCEDAIGACVISGLQPDVENIFRISMLHTVLLITQTAEEGEELLRKKETLANDVRGE